MEVPHGRQDAQRVRDRAVDRHRVVAAAAGVAPVREDRLEALAADVVHDDVARTLVGDEVVNADDVGVVERGEEPALGHRRQGRLLAGGVEQALEHHPAVGDRPVTRQVDPSQAAVGKGAEHLVLAADQVTRSEPRREGERVRHWRQNPSGSPGRWLRERPTGLLHLEQKRLSSGTWATGMTAARGSPVGTAGTSTRPSPSRVPRSGGRPPRRSPGRRAPRPAESVRTDAGAGEAGRSTAGRSLPDVGGGPGPRPAADEEGQRPAADPRATGRDPAADPRATGRARRQTRARAAGGGPVGARPGVRPQVSQ